MSADVRARARTLTDGQGVVLRSPKVTPDSRRQGPRPTAYPVLADEPLHKQRDWIGQIVCFKVEKPEWILLPNNLVLFKFTGLRDVSQQ